MALSSDEYLLLDDQLVTDLLVGLDADADADETDATEHPAAAAAAAALAPRGRKRKAHPETQRRYRERQKEYVRSLEERVRILTARVAAQDNAGAPAAPAPTGEGEANAAAPPPATKAEAQLQVELIELQFQTAVDAMRNELHNGASDAALERHLSRLADLCQSVARVNASTGHDEALAVLRDMKRFTTHGTSTDAAEHWDKVLAEAGLAEEVCERVVAWRAEYIDAMAAVFDERERALGELHDTNRQSMLGASLVQANHVRAVEALRENLHQQQRILAKFIKSFFHDALGSPQTSARVIVASAPVHVDPLALANYMQSRRKRQ